MTEDIFIASLRTSSIRFEAVGRTMTEARGLIQSAVERHCQQDSALDFTPYWNKWRVAIRYLPARIGHSYRDGEPFL